MSTTAVTATDAVFEKPLAGAGLGIRDASESIADAGNKIGVFVAGPATDTANQFKQTAANVEQYAKDAIARMEARWNAITDKVDTWLGIAPKGLLGAEPPQWLASGPVVIEAEADDPICPPDARNVLMAVHGEMQGTESQAEYNHLCAAFRSDHRRMWGRIYRRTCRLYESKNPGVKIGEGFDWESIKTWIHDHWPQIVSMLCSIISLFVLLA